MLVLLKAKGMQAAKVFGASHETPKDERAADDAK
jgi:hypothetical protein